MKNRYENEKSVEQFHQHVNDTIGWFFERYKMLNSLLGYLIANDYEGLLIISSEEWNENIFQHNFFTGWRLEESDGNIYIEGKENE